MYVPLSYLTFDKNLTFGTDLTFETDLTFDTDCGVTLSPFRMGLKLSAQPGFSGPSRHSQVVLWFC